MRPEMKYGLIAGFGMSGWLLLEFLLGFHTTRLSVSSYTSWGTEIILVVTVGFLLRHKLTQGNRYWLPLWEGVLSGLLAGFIAGTLLCTFYNLYLTFLNPAWPDHYLNWQVAQMRADAVSEEKILHFARSFRRSVTPAGLLTNIIGMEALLGMIAASVLTLWLNWRNKEIVQPR